MRKSVSILLVSIYIVSCNRLDVSIDTQINRIEKIKEIEITDNNNPFIFNTDDINRTKNIKLTKEDKDRLVAFGANKYASALLSFYNKYDNFYEATITYYNCDNNDVSCKNKSLLLYKNNDNIFKLNYSNLTKEFRALVVILKESAPNYISTILSEAIDKVEHCFKKAVDSNQTHKDYLIIDANCIYSYFYGINIAITDYIDAFTSVVNVCSSLYFTYSVRSFADMAKKFAKKRGIKSITAIACAIEAIVSSGSIEEAKKLAEELDRERENEGKEFAKAIDALNVAYKTVTL
ncbi:hypothetical protein DB313_05175 (plasmid) [Borrelia turcica IST7]|uniref:Uncharacterized protein n=1 Tax=Borrelia turcica IST7 TaxID=1104446 RepID=A0A386PMX7_9SPIR|nr:hypothetical protein [Borrelia turcica]AYE36891.1 hypothetical protein DB313_05175 [Borrelia turcica IST7]